ncbi:MAG: glycerol-3-phosphate acyltransferase [Rickettsiales bacterium]|jgi:glycerol-3-phosphate acyltransferase PlsY|nr:glycerol-3-phosphate acyltransferase [Rickettsiales bacterium]
MYLENTSISLIMNWTTMFLVSFLLSAIPFGYLLVKFIKKVDIRNYGSGNTGATNVWRILGAKYAVLTFLLDGTKSLVPVLLANRVSGGSVTVAMIMLLMTVAGHIFSPWLGWKGGKGFSSFILGLLAVDYRLFLITGLSWSIVFFISRISGLATLVSILTTLIGSYFVVNDTSLCILAIISTVIFWAHRKNIRDLTSRVVSGRS